MKVGIKLRKEDDVWKPYIDKLSDLVETEVIYGKEITTVCTGVEILITTNLTDLDVEKLPDLKAVFLFKTGMDGLPMDILKRKKIKVYPSHANADVIAEHALALALALLHRVVEFDADLRQNIWFSDGVDYYWRSLSELKVGILGYGSIGSCLGKKLSGLSSQIMGLNNKGKYDVGIIAADDFNQLIEWSDILFICVPKTGDTVGMVNADVLSKMAGKYIVNVSRAEICDEAALYHSLKKGTLAGYASDVWYFRPEKADRTKAAQPANYPFNELHNVVMSPHCATHEFSSHERYIADAVEQCIQYIEGGFL